MAKIGDYYKVSRYEYTQVTPRNLCLIDLHATLTMERDTLERKYMDDCAARDEEYDEAVAYTDDSKLSSAQDALDSVTQALLALMYYVME